MLLWLYHMQLESITLYMYMFIVHEGKHPTNKPHSSYHCRSTRPGLHVIFD